MVTLSRLYLRREGGVPGSPALSWGSEDKQSRSLAPDSLTWGRYPGPAFLGLPTSLVPSAEVGAAAGRAGPAASAPRPPGRVARFVAARDAEVAEGISSGLKGFEAGLWKEGLLRNCWVLSSASPPVCLIIQAVRDAGSS